MADQKSEEVLAAARPVFLRYGFKRTTMGDLAEAAGMSRPGLYLVFPSKEEIFGAVMERSFADQIRRIREGLDRYETTPDKLAFAFEVWCVEPFETTLVSPDARDLLDSTCAFANDLLTAAFGEFKTIVAEVLAQESGPDAPLTLPLTQVARIMVDAMTGLKKSARDAEDLRAQIGGLIAVVCAGLGRAG